MTSPPLGAIDAIEALISNHDATSQWWVESWDCSRSPGHPGMPLDEEIAKQARLALSKLKAVVEAARQFETDVRTSIVSSVAHQQGAHDGHSLAFYSPPMSELPVFEELRQAKQALKRERESIHCQECGGRGRTWTQGPYHGADSDCWRCSGRGRHDP